MSRTERALHLNRKAAFIVTLVLIPVLVLLSLRLARALTDTHDIRWTPPARIANTHHDPGGPDYQRIQAAHLFGASSPEVEEITDIIEAPPTTLALSLRGIVASSDEQFSHVIIGDDSGRENIYFVKNEVSGGTRIVAIYADRVILERAGRHETLWLPRYGEAPDADRMAESSSPADEAASAPQPEVQQLITPPPARLADIMMPRPHLKSGRFAGLEVYPGERREMFATLGLKSGDVIVKIDGRELSEADTATPFLELATDASMTLTIDRGGKAVTLKIANGAPVPVTANRPVT